MSSFPIVTKRAYEERIFEVNLGPRMRPEDVILDVTGVMAEDGITIDSISWTAGTCQFRASGGHEGGVYPILIQFTTVSNPTQRLEAEVHLVIKRGAELD